MQTAQNTGLDMKYCGIYQQTTLKINISIFGKAVAEVEADRLT